VRGKQRTIFLACGLAVVALAAFAIWRRVDREPLSQREIAMRSLGEYLRKEANPRAVLVAGNPFSQMSGRPAQVYAFEKASEAGLRKGLGAGVDAQVDFPKLKPEALKNASAVYIDPRTTTPLSFLVAEGSFDELARAHPNADVLVSLIGLPLDTTREEFWTKGKIRIALLLPDFRMVGDLESVRGAFKSGKIIAAVVERPGVARTDEPVRGDYKAEFEKRFVLVTRENVDGLLPLLIH
jgi:hypothetical protein